MSSLVLKFTFGIFRPCLIGCFFTDETEADHIRTGTVKYRTEIWKIVCMTILTLYVSVFNNIIGRIAFTGDCSDVIVCKAFRVAAYDEQ